jgi:hypothetical protein
MIILSLFFACSSTPSSDADIEAPENTPQLEIEPTGSSDALRGTPTSPKDGEPPFGIQAADCDSVPKDAPIEGPDCITGVLSCGDTVVGHTQGGSNKFTTRFYEKHFCTPATTDHDSGDERVYQLNMPDGDWTADVYLDTPCGDLDLAALKWTGESCPTEASMVGQCEMSVREGGHREHLKLSSRKATSWLLAVEGKDASEGAFALVVTCREGL